MRFRLIDAFRVAGRSVLALTLLAIGTLAVPALVHDKPAAAATDWGKALVDSTMARFPDARSLPWRYPRATQRQREPAQLVSDSTGCHELLD